MRTIVDDQSRSIADVDRPESVSSARPSSDRTGATPAAQRASSHRQALAVAVLGFFVVTLDALVVNVALPAIGRELGGGITGLQWVVDGYTLMFAALLLSAGALSDRIGARKAYGVGLALFVAASAACGLVPTMGVLVTARLAQGAGAAVMMPAWGFIQTAPKICSEPRSTRYDRVFAGSA